MLPFESRRPVRVLRIQDYSVKMAGNSIGSFRGEDLGFKKKQPLRDAWMEWRFRARDENAMS
jgi:hypothetical protein